MESFPLGSKSKKWAESHFYDHFLALRIGLDWLACYMLIGDVDSFILGILAGEMLNFAIHFSGHSCPNLGAVSIVIPLKPIQRIWPELNSALVLLKISVLFFRGSELPESLKADSWQIV